jgi:branched-chain amino acid transport system ATP-binding protein
MKPAAQAELLTVEHLSIRSDGASALEDVSFGVREREIVAIAGPVGAGKRTLLTCLTGARQASDGSVTLHRGGHSHRLDRMDAHRVARVAGVAYVGPDAGPFPGMTLLENLMVAQRVGLMRAGLFSVSDLLGFSPYRRAEKGAAVKARNWLDRLGLGGRGDMAAGALSHGDRRRLEIARAMCTNPVLLCLGEPATGCAPREWEGLGELLRSICDRDGIGVLLSHNGIDGLTDLAARIVVLDRGRQIAEGRPDEVLVNSAVIAAFGGERDADETRE